MSVKIEQEDRIVTAFLSGEIDHHTAKEIREEYNEITEYVKIAPNL